MNLKVSLLFRSYLGLTRGDQLLFCAGKHVHHCCYWLDSAASFPCQRRMLCADFAQPCSKMRFCSQHCGLPLRMWNQALPTVLASSLPSRELGAKTYCDASCGSCILTCEKQLFRFFLIFPFSPDEFIDNCIDNRSITKNSPKHSRADRGPIHPCHSHRLILRTKTFFRSRTCSLQTSTICTRPCKKIHTAQRPLVTTAVHRLLPHLAFLQRDCAEAQGSELQLARASFETTNWTHLWPNDSARWRNCKSKGCAKSANAKTTYCTLTVTCQCENKRLLSTNHVETRWNKWVYNGLHVQINGHCVTCATKPCKSI